jgi:SAM-dependent methyltransferase
MKEGHLKFLNCPECKSDLKLLEVKINDNDSIESGKLQCLNCKLNYPIIRHIPRFVPLENYASGFGLEWSKHARTQYDSYSGVNVSEKRFFEETKWPRDLAGQIILEVGSGSGRFTEHAASTGAMVFSTDYSYAVEANYASNGKKNNVFIVQADIYKMPFRENIFDKLFCFGVLQHTPDVREAFLQLPRYLKSGGDIAVDVYLKRNNLKRFLITKYWVRPFTKRMNPKILYKITSNYVNIMWPLSKLIHKIPYGRQINWALLVADYRGVFDLKEDILKEWAILDTFDMLSPTYDKPQTIETVKQWFNDADLSTIDVHYGYNGIEGRGKRP